jgi:hypothetical protein
MSHTIQSHALPITKGDAKTPKPEELEDVIVPTDDPEKAAAYRISEIEISPEQKKEEARIMSVSVHPRKHTKSLLTQTFQAKSRPQINPHPRRPLQHRRPRPRKSLQRPRSRHEQRSRIQYRRSLHNCVISLLYHLFPFRNAKHIVTSLRGAKATIECFCVELGVNYVGNGVGE